MSGLRTERVTLEIVRGDGLHVRQWPWRDILKAWGLGEEDEAESVRVVDGRAGTDMGNGVTVASTEEVLAMCRETEGRLTAEREAAREECERLRIRVAELEAAPQAAPGWLTPEEREAVACAATSLRQLSSRQYVNGDQDAARDTGREEGFLRALLARSTPPKVKLPRYLHAHPHYGQVLREVSAAIREAGGEVE